MKTNQTKNNSSPSFLLFHHLFICLNGVGYAVYLPFVQTALFANVNLVVCC